MVNHNYPTWHAELSTTQLTIIAWLNRIESPLAFCWLGYARKSHPLALARELFARGLGPMPKRSTLRTTQDYLTFG